MCPGTADNISSSPLQHRKPRAVGSMENQTCREAGTRGGRPLHAVQRVHGHSRGLLSAVGDIARPLAPACSTGLGPIHHDNCNRTLVALQMRKGFRQRIRAGSCVCLPVAWSRLSCRYFRPGQVRNRHSSIPSLTSLWHSTSRRRRHFNGSLHDRPPVVHTDMPPALLMSLRPASASAYGIK
jgi:hypothetical protein